MDFANTSSGGTPKSTNKAYYDGGIIPWINSGELSSHSINSALNFITEEGLKNSSAKIFPVNSVLVALYGATAGKASLLNIEASTNQAICAILPNRDYDSRFLKYNIDSLYFHLIKISTGSARDNLSQDIIKELEIVFPQLKIQQRIASVLSSLDDKIELNNRINAELEAMAKTLYDYWFVQFDFPDANGKPYKSSGGKMVYNEELKREIPEGWDVAELDTLLIEFTKGITTKYVEKSNLINLNQKVNKGAKLEREYFKYLDKSIPIPKEKYAQRKDILINSLGQGTLGRVHFFRDKDANIVVDQHLFILRCDDNIIKPTYLYLFLSSAPCQKQIERQITGSTGMLMLNSSNLRTLQIIKPKIEQLNEFENKAFHLYNTIARNESENQHLSSLRDWLLPMLMNGQVGFKEEHQEQVQTVSVAAEAKVEYKPSNPKNDKYHKIQSVYVVLWANSLLGVKQGEMATAKDLYLVDRIAGVHTGFTYAQHSWGSFDPAFKQTINNKYFTKRNFPDSPAHYCDTADNGYLLAKIPEDTKEKVKSSIEELHHKIFKKYFGKQKAEMKELYATVLKCIEDAQSTTFAVIRQTMKDWKTPKQNFPDKAIKFSEQLTKEALDTIIREGWDRNVMRNEG